MHFFLFHVRQYNVTLLKSASFSVWGETILQNSSMAFFRLNSVKPDNSRYQDIFARAFTAYRREARLEDVMPSFWKLRVVLGTNPSPRKKAAVESHAFSCYHDNYHPVAKVTLN